MAPIILIPARLNSRRYPRKLIEHKVSGVPLIQHIFCKACQYYQTYVTCSAKDAEDFLKYIPDGNIILSSDNHINGSSRVLEAAEKLTPIYGDDFMVVNLQGDNLDIPDLSQLEKYPPYEDILSFYYKDKELRNDTKVDIDNGLAVWFTRMDLKANDTDQTLYDGYFYHVGVYCYRLSVLRQLPFRNNEENLEQVAWLEAGWDIRMVECEKVLSIDYPN